MRKWMIIPVVVIGMFICGCSEAETGGGQVMDGDGMFQIFRYTQISQEEAKEMMQKDDGHVIVDVRRQDEYDEGHIPGAILIPNESIADIPPAELPDFDQIILVYCRSGRRSKEAAQKLADMGYSQVYEFGGIIDWTGEVVKDDPDRANAGEFLEGTWGTASQGYEYYGQAQAMHYVRFDGTDIIYGHMKDEEFVPDHTDKVSSIEQLPEGGYIIKAETEDGDKYTYRTAQSDMDALNYYSTWNEDEFSHNYHAGSSLSRLTSR